MCSLFVMGILNMNVLFVTMFFVTTIGIELPAIHLLRNIHFLVEKMRSLSHITFINSIIIFIQHNMCVSVLHLIDEI